jgi:serine/threonine protein phosphatase 1
MRYAIGDIHGEYDKLRNLIDILDKDATEYIFLGDYIDKGKDSKKVIDFLMELVRAKKCIFLMGDHEYMWTKLFIDTHDREAREFLLHYGGDKTFASLKSVYDYYNFKYFLFGLLFYYETPDYFCVHAGIKNGEPDYFVRDEFINSKELYHGKRVIFGHTAFKKPYVDKYKIGIDTGAVYPDMGLLTAYNLDTGEFVYHDGRKEMIKQ